MTLVVVVKVPCRRLNPKRKPLRFEPGIVLGVDTRFTFDHPHRGPRDDAQKWWTLGSRSFATYAGDVELAEKAILLTRAACQEHGLDDHGYIRRALRTLLRYCSKEIAKSRALNPTIIIFAARTLDGGFTLYRLASRDEFQPGERDGFVIEGSGERYTVGIVLEDEIEALAIRKTQTLVTALKLAIQEDQVLISQREPSDLENVSLLDVAGMLFLVVERVIRDAGIHSVGGKVFMLTLSRMGLFPVLAKERSPGAAQEWLTVTPESLRSHQDVEMRGRKYVGPLLDVHGHISSTVIAVWTDSSPSENTE